jgi:hypothetical protein
MVEPERALESRQSALNSGDTVDPWDGASSAAGLIVSESAVGEGLRLRAMI